MARARSWNLDGPAEQGELVPGSLPAPPQPVVLAPTRGRTMAPEDRWLSEWLAAEAVRLPAAVRSAHRDWLQTFE